MQKFRQTEARQRVSATQLASISLRKHVSDKIWPGQFKRHIVILSPFGNTTPSELTKHSSPALTTPVKIIKSF